MIHRRRIAATLSSDPAWVTACLGDVAAITMGQSPPSTTINEDGDGLPFVQGNAEFGFRNPRPTKFCTDPPKQAEPGTILLSVRAPVGALNRAHERLAIGRGLSAIDATGIDPEFLWHALGRTVSHLVRVSQGSTFPAVSKADLHTLEFSLPPPNEQRKVAAVLSSVDDSIEKTQAVVDQVQVVKRGVMQELFTRSLPSDTRFRRTQIVGPSGWTILPLVDACVARGQYGANVAKRDFAPGGIRYIRITDIDEHGSLKDASVGINAADAGGYLLAAGDILLARSGTVGKSYLHEDIRVRCAFAGYLVRFRTRDEVLLPAFLKEYLNTAAFWRWVADRQHAQAQPNINAREYGQLPVPCPPLDEQRRIVDIAASFTGAIQSGRDEIRSLHLLKQSLLSVLLTGEVRVRVDTEAA